MDEVERIMQKKIENRHKALSVAVSGNYVSFENNYSGKKILPSWMGSARVCMNHMQDPRYGSEFRLFE
jgi:hypothetical protein